jgi:hypothetical protein
MKPALTDSRAETGDGFFWQEGKDSLIMLVETAGLSAARRVAASKWIAGPEQ